MLIVSLKQHFPARLPEWWMSLQLVMWGSYTVLHPGMFTQPSARIMFSGMVEMAGSFPPAGLWGLSAVFIGCIRAGALFVNGAYSRTPLVRLSMSFLSAFIWTQICLGLWKSGVENTGVVNYAGLVMLDIASAYRAATDVVYAEKVRHDLRKQQGSRRVQHSSIS